MTKYAFRSTERLKNKRRRSLSPSGHILWPRGGRRHRRAATNTQHKSQCVTISNPRHVSCRCRRGLAIGINSGMTPRNVRCNRSDVFISQWKQLMLPKCAVVEKWRIVFDRRRGCVLACGFACPLPRFLFFLRTSLVCGDPRPVECFAGISLAFRASMLLRFKRS